MPRSYIRPVTQIRKSDAYNDEVTAGSTMESNAVNIEDDLNAIRSQLRRIIDETGNWYDEPVTDLVTTQAETIPAKCLHTDEVGMCVYVTGTKSMGRSPVTAVDIKTAGKYPAIGVIKSKSDATTCIVQVNGTVTVGLPFLSPGEPHFVGFDARPVVTPPTAAAGEIVAVQPIGTALENGELLLNVGAVHKRRG